jgi:site-specific recombinase XerD
MEKTYKDLTEEFHQDYLNSGFAKQTAAKKVRELKRFFTYLIENGLTLNELRVKHAQGYQGWLIEKGRLDGARYKTGSIACLMKAALAFYEFLKKKSIIYSNPFNDIEKIKQEKKIPENLLKEKHMNKLLEKLSHFDEDKSIRKQVQKYKTHVIAELMYSTALRISEVAALTVKDIDLERGVVYVEQGKGDKRRECFLNDYAKEVLRLYLKEFYPLVLTGNHNKELLFGSGESRLGKMINKELKNTCKKLGLRNITSHGFRHSVGFHLLRSGCDIRHIQALLGHDRLKNTEIYTRVDKRDLKEVLDKYHPRKMRSIKNEELTRQGSYYNLQRLS